MVTDGMLQCLLVDALPNGNVFAKKKNATKAALLLDGRPINARGAGDRPPTFPTLEQLGTTMALMKARGVTMWFTKLDV